MKVQTIEAGRVTPVSAGRFGYSLKINGALVPQGVTPFTTFDRAKKAMRDRVRAHVVATAQRKRAAIAVAAHMEAIAVAAHMQGAV